MPRFSPPTYKRKVDLNHSEVRDALRAAGYKVADFSGVGKGVPDLLVYTGRDRVDEAAWCEVKTLGEKLTEAEQFFFDNAPGQKIIAYGGQDAIDKMFVLFKGLPR